MGTFFITEDFFNFLVTKKFQLTNTGVIIKIKKMFFFTAETLFYSNRKHFLLKSKQSLPIKLKLLSGQNKTTKSTLTPKLMLNQQIRTSRWLIQWALTLWVPPPPPSNLTFQKITLRGIGKMSLCLYIAVRALYFLYYRALEWCLSTSSWSVMLRRNFTAPTLHSITPVCLTAATTAASSSIQIPGPHRSVAAVPLTSPPISPSNSTRPPRRNSISRGAAAPKRHLLPLDRLPLPATSSTRPPPPPHPLLIHTPSTQVPPPP